MRPILALTMQCGVTARLRFDTGLLELMLRYYPGTRIVYAAESGDVASLSERERATYERAQQIVASARAAADTPLMLERALHDWLCATSVIPTRRRPRRRRMARRRRLRPWAPCSMAAQNCQGFADAFYLLGKLAGFDVRRQSGTAGARRTPGTRSCWTASGTWWTSRTT